MASEPPPAIRDRYLVVDDFLPLDLARAMRADIDAHFANPNAHQPSTHQVWNYWFVPELYAYLRTQPEKVIQPGRAREFHDRLLAWSLGTLGLGAVTWPYLSLYIAGCRQSLHNDSVNGRFGFVYSLTNDERRTVGGETVIHREGDPFRALSAAPGAGRSFYDMIAPRFNRLVIFDDRMPHAVERVDGPMDPREGRFVLHGHISESGPAVIGPLATQALTVVAPVVETLKAFTEDRFLDGYQGPLTARLDISPDGSVAGGQLLLDRVIHPDPHDGRWPALAREVLDRLSAQRFPAAEGASILIVPIIFGAAMGPGG